MAADEASSSLPCNSPALEQLPLPKAPSPRRAKHEGSFAVDQSHGVVGSYCGEPDAGNAETEVIEDCRLKEGKDCTVQASFANAHGALLVGDKTPDLNWGDMESIALEKAMKVRLDADTGRRAYFKTYRLAVRTG